MRGGKQFDLAFRAVTDLGFNLQIAGHKNSLLWVEHERMPEFYRSIDLLLITSAFEAHPLVAYEGIACGCPVVMEWKVGDCWEEHVEGILYYKGFEIDTIQQAILQALLQRDALSRAGPICIEQSWTWDKMKPKYIEMFKSVSGQEYPYVLVAINERDWAWDFMVKEISEFVYPVDVYYLEDYEPGKFDFDKYDLIINHVWGNLHPGNVKEYPMNKNVMSVNGPAFLNPEFEYLFRANVMRSPAITTVSKSLIPLLAHHGKPIYHCSRGINTEMFHP
jgi:hypothetical protein